MTRYSVQPRDFWVIDFMDFCILLKIWVKTLAKT